MGTLGELMGIHVSVTVLQRLLGFIRVLVLARMLELEQMALWGLGSMIFVIIGPLMTLGTDTGTERYVSLFESRGRLALFYKKMRFGVLLLVMIVGAGLLLNTRQITAVVISVGKGVAGVAVAQQVLICCMAVINAMLWALHLNLLAFLKGMRVYRIVSVVHIFFGVLFTVMSACVLWFWPTAVAALIVHAIALGLTMALALWFVHFGVTHTAKRERSEHDRRKTPRQEQIDRRSPRPEQKLPQRIFTRLLTFGLLSVLGTALWSANAHISFYMIYRNGVLDKGDAGVFFTFMRLSHPVVLLAHAAWAVLFVHVARRWESGRRKEAMYVLETAYKGIAVAIMTLAIIVYALAPYWVLILRSEYRVGACLVGPLLMSFLSVAFMALMTMIARLRERPAAIAAAAMAAGAANITLGLIWIGPYGIMGAARAAGVGMFLGVGIVSVVFLLLSRIRLHWSTLGVLLLPAILLLPPWIALAFWAVVLAVLLRTGLAFTKTQKHMLLSGMKNVTKLVGKGRS